MVVSNFKLRLTAALAAITFALCPTQSAFAQTTVTYTYDANGRMITAASTAGQTETVTYDDAGNITNAKSTGGSGGGGNSSPACTNQVYISLHASFNHYGPSSCTDADGDPITVTSVSDPAGATTATVNSYMVIQFANLQYGTNIATVTVSDGNGGTGTYTITIYR